ncbi:MAG: hypothetical protein ACLQVJ_11230, partial [Syntrophobacteraceae bacterium]
TPPRGDAVSFDYRERASPGRGLSPLRSCPLPGARTPAFAGVTASLDPGSRIQDFRDRLRRGDVYRVFRPDLGTPIPFHHPLWLEKAGV